MLRQDFFCSVKIIDESRTSGGYVHFFTESMESLPQVENVGDVLVARNFKVNELHFLSCFFPPPFSCEFILGANIFVWEPLAVLVFHSWNFTGQNLERGGDLC